MHCTTLESYSYCPELELSDLRLLIITGVLPLDTYVCACVGGGVCCFKVHLGFQGQCVRV